MKESPDGAKLHRDAVNARGGINSQQVKRVSVDDKSDPEVTVAVAREMITPRGVLALFPNRGTPHAQPLVAFNIETATEQVRVGNMLGIYRYLQRTQRGQLPFPGSKCRGWGPAPVP